MGKKPPSLKPIDCSIAGKCRESLLASFNGLSKNRFKGIRSTIIKLCRRFNSYHRCNTVVMEEEPDGHMEVLRLAEWLCWLCKKDPLVIRSWDPLEYIKDNITHGTGVRVQRGWAKETILHVGHAQVIGCDHNIGESRQFGAINGAIKWTPPVEEPEVLVRNSFRSQPGRDDDERVSHHSNSG
mgnify:CR=1 FL=1